MKYGEKEGKNRKPIVALGELLVDLVPGIEGMRIEDEGPVIKTASGSAGIFACAASLLGAKSRFLGKIGRDKLSRMVFSTLEKQGVDVSGVVISDEGQMGLAFLEYLPEGRNYQYYRTNSVGSLFRAEELKEDCISSAFAVHYPGMLLELTEEMRGACQKMVEIAKKHHVPVSFDPNIRRELNANSSAGERLLQAVKSADIVAPTFSEGRMITGKETLGDVIRALHALGPRVVAVTRDKDGAVISFQGQTAVAKGIDEKAVDPTGAGDTLAAALCVGLQENMSLCDLAAFCNCAGTLVITRKGAIGMALPTRKEVENYMASGVCRVESIPLSELP